MALERWQALVLIVAAVSLVGTLAAIAYGRWRAMLDAPAHRRLHRRPTVRGAGLGFVLGMQAALLFGWLWDVLDGATAIRWALSLGLVAGVGWWDDHRPLSARWRLLAHLLAITLVLPWSAAAGWTWLLLPVALLIGAAMINFYNFLDGSNGMAAGQAILAGALLALTTADPRVALLGASVAAACLAFLPFNAPKARAFMGDVGSGALGFWFALIALAVSTPAREPLAAVAIILSAVWADAAFTLIWRMSRGPKGRWYTAHREHLYQWLVRSGHTHVRVALLYAAWTLGPAAFCLWLLGRYPSLDWVLIIVLYLLAALVWISQRQRLLRQAWAERRA